jgi:two-component system sensor histidine kinase PilS (NtrC family)
VPVAALAGRLLAVGGIFTLTVLLELVGRAPYSEQALTALYAVVLGGFFATLAQGLLAAYGQERSSAMLELASDVFLITALIYCTGGARSVFGFLYLVWIVYTALRIGSRGAAVSPLLATGGYALATLGVSAGWIPPLDPGDPVPTRDALSALGTHSVAFALVSLLAHRLTRQIVRGQAELRELGEIYRRIFENVSTGILTVDRAGRITSFNAEAERITGYGPDVISSPIERLLPGISRVIPISDAEPPEAGAAELAGRLSRLQFDFTNREGASLHLGLSHSLLRDSLGQVDGGVLIFQDLTHVTRIEDELHRSERLAAVGQLAAGLAHEIRNPLASLSGSIELLAAELPSKDPSARRLAAIVGRETERLNRLVSDFLRYARPGPARRETLWLRELLEELEELVAQREACGVGLELDVPADLAVCGDPDQLRQVLWNLVLNALQAEPQGPVRVCVGLVAGEPGGVEISVEDNGAGIPPDQLGRIFEPFFTTKARGTGLGLATVHRVAEAHGGSASVRSEVGKGTRVCVRLPRALPE